MSSTRQWKREVELIIGKSGSGVLVKDLRVSFEIIKTIDPEPNQAVIKVYNLSPTNEAKIKNEYDEVILNVGYKDGGKRIIFRGNLQHVFKYKDRTDIITELVCGDGDKDFRDSVINETLAAGTTDAQLVERALKTMPNTTQGEIQVTGSRRIRGKVVSGNTRDVLKNIASENDSNFSIQDGQLQIVKANGVLKDEVILINVDTGMLNIPEVNDKGIAVKCLLNPQLRINGRIKLDNNNLKYRYKAAKPLAGKNEKEDKKKGIPVRLDPDGIYKVIKITQKGDNRGPDWESSVECIGINEPVPKSR